MRTLLYQTIAEHFETWFELVSAGQFDGQGDHHSPKPYVRQAFRKYLECGIFAQSLQSNCPGAARLDKTAAHLGAIAFIHRFGSNLNGHVHFHVCVVDGVFEEVPLDTDAQSSPPGVIFHPASAIDETAVARVQTDLRRRILRAFVGRGLIVKADAKDMLGYPHSGFSVDAGVCIQANDRAALERLLRYCARPPFAMERLRKEGAALVYRRQTAQRAWIGQARCQGGRADPHTTGTDRSHCGPGATAAHAPAKQVVVQTEPAATGEGGVPGVVHLGHAIPSTPESAPPKRSPAHYLWAVLIARIYEVFPLLGPKCGGQMRLIAFITEGVQIRRILEHICVDSQPPHIFPARGPPLWDDGGDAQMDVAVKVEPDWDLAAQPEPDFEADQRISW